MVAVVYEVDRAILLLIYLFLTFLSLLQIYVSHRLHKKNTDTKKNLVHYCIFLASFFLFLGVIDLAGVFQIFNRYAVLTLVGIGWNFLVLGSLFVIHSHFQAHYLSLRKTMSMSSFWFLGTFLLLGFLTYLLGQCLTEKYNQMRYQSYSSIYVLLEIIIILIYDGVGYWKIRNLLVQAVRLEDPEYQEPSWCCSYTRIPEDPKRKQTVVHGLDYEVLLKRMRKFHTFIFFAGTCFILFFLWVIPTQFQHMNEPPVYPDPNIFQFDVTSHVFIPSLFIYTWWAWVPLSDSENQSTIDGSGDVNKNNSKKGKSNNDDSRMASTHMSRETSGGGVEIGTRVIGPEQEAFLPEADREISSSLASPSSPSKGTGMFRFETVSGIRAVENNQQIEESPRDVEQFAGSVGSQVECVRVGDDDEMDVL